MLPSALTRYSRVNSGIFKTETATTSVGPITYSWSGKMILSPGPLIVGTPLSCALDGFTISNTDPMSRRIPKALIVFLLMTVLSLRESTSA